MTKPPTSTSQLLIVEYKNNPQTKGYVVQSHRTMAIVIPLDLAWILILPLCI